ncbi:sigma factor-like helix-turn-helix DNA-binding protein [Streptomyces sp. NPDC086077]|uniref:RNA polymerase sigma factor n=1 Tax=Streptomyces sp. NPDC086077 TaxID=3154862 RepID=UPI003429A856
MVTQPSLRRLPPEHRAVLVHIYLCDRTINETPAILGVPAGTVKSRHHNARRKLHNAFRTEAACGQQGWHSLAWGNLQHALQSRSDGSDPVGGIGAECSASLKGCPSTARRRAVDTSSVDAGAEVRATSAASLAVATNSCPTEVNTGC